MRRIKSSTRACSDKAQEICRYGGGGSMSKLKWTAQMVLVEEERRDGQSRSERKREKMYPRSIIVTYLSMFFLEHCLVVNPFG